MADEQENTPDSTVDVVNVKNEKVGSTTLPGHVFGTKINEHLIYEAVKHQRAARRRGTHATKTRAEVSGTGRKPWRQKGTGRARVGEARNPLWRHGGTVFGPRPRDYSYAMPRKARASALRSALSQRVKDGALRVVDNFPIQVPSEAPLRLTRQLAGMLADLGAEGKTLIVVFELSPALVLSSRNLPGVRVTDTSHVTVYDVLDCRHLLICQDALGSLEERLLP